MFYAYLIIFSVAGIIFFGLYLALDFFRTPGGANAFWDKWVRKTIWIWLPFYALQRLLREFLFKK
jgi:hypothetical protein